jgi:hypothetical protein
MPLQMAARRHAAVIIIIIIIPTIMANMPEENSVPAAPPVPPLSPFWHTVWHSVIVGIVAVVGSVFLAGGGHGTSVPAALCFPWTMLSLENDEITQPMLYFALVQFPLYGILIGAARSAAARRPNLALIVITIIAVVHVSAVILLLSRVPADF